MFGGLLDKATSILDPRTVLVSLVPTLVFWAAVAALAGSQVGWKAATKDWSGLDSLAKILVTVLAVAALVLFSMVLSALEGRILSTFEGYWGTSGLGAWAAGKATRRHQKIQRNLDLTDERAYEFRYRNYPRREADVMPTRLGNVLKAAETYPADTERYHLDAVFFWPRLIAVIPQSARDDLSDSRAGLALLLNVCTLAGVVGLGDRKSVV